MDNPVKRAIRWLSYQRLPGMSYHIHKSCGFKCDEYMDISYEGGDTQEVWEKFTNLGWDLNCCGTCGCCPCGSWRCVDCLWDKHLKRLTRWAWDEPVR